MQLVKKGQCKRSHNDVIIVVYEDWKQQNGECVKRFYVLKNNIFSYSYCKFSDVDMRNGFYG